MLKGTLRLKLEARVEKAEEELLELYKRCDLLLQVDTEASLTIASLTENVSGLTTALEKITKNQKNMAETLKQMTH